MFSYLKKKRAICNPVQGDNRAMSDPAQGDNGWWWEMGTAPQPAPAWPLHNYGWTHRKNTSLGEGESEKEMRHRWQLSLPQISSSSILDSLMKDKWSHLHEDHGVSRLCVVFIVLFCFFFKKKSFQLRGINSILQTLKIKTVFQIFVQKQSLIILYEWHISFK